jgi:hypothetical protein
MQAEGHLLTEILGNVRFSVPPWQRRYAWQEENWKTLWESLSDVRKAPVGSQHFMGALVFQRAARQSSGLVVHHRIIDGQQRLVTLSLIFAAIRDRLKGYADTEDRRQQIAGLESLLFNPGAGSKLADRLKVLPYGDDLASYEGCLSNPQEEPRDTLGRAHFFFQEKLASLSESQLVRLRNAMASSLYFAAVYLEDKDDAHKIFRSLNEAGLTLAPTDHIRNNLFMSAGRLGDSLYVGHWQPLERLLRDGDALLGFLFAEQARLPHSPRSVTKKDLHHVYSGGFAALAGKPRRITAYVERLEEHGELFRALREPSSIVNCNVPTPQKLKPELERLQEWGSLPGETSTLDILVGYKDRQLKAADAVSCLRLIEAFLVRRFLAGEKANLLSRIFTDLVDQFPEHGSYLVRLRTALSTPAHAWGDDGTVIGSLGLLNFYSQGSAPQRRFILKELNCNALQRGRLKRMEFAPNWTPDLTIEHIMPQTLDDGWRRILEKERRKLKLAESVDDLHQAHVNLLGNLTLARQARNVQYSNRPFKDKVALINKELPIRLNSELGKGRYATWGFSAIQRRTRELARLACAIWEGPAGR